MNAATMGESRKRVLDALSFRQPDRLPVDLWAEPEVKDNLIKHLNCSKWDEVLEILEVDVRTIEPVIPADIYESATIRRNIWGERWKKSYLGWQHTDGALYGAQTVEELEAYRWPSCDNNDYSTLSEQIEQAEGRAILYGFSDIWERAAMVIGIENMLVQMAENPPFVHYLVRKFCDYYKEDWRRAIEATSGKIDMMLQMTDLGTQISQFISLEMFREYLKPYFTELFAVPKAAGIKCMFHSCGCVAPFIPDLIETGMDILNPIQVSAAQMDSVILKRSFGEKIAFHGAIDEQKTLCVATPEQVQQEVLDAKRILGADGGYIMCSTHFLQNDIPIENILAMYDTALR